MNSLEIKEQTVNSLLLRRSRLNELSQLVFLILFLCFWYWFMVTNSKFGQHVSQMTITDWMSRPGNIAIAFIAILFFVLPLLSLITMVRHIKVIVFGDIYKFEKHYVHMIRNGKKEVAFYDVENVCIRVVYDSERADEYSLSLSLKGGGRYFIESGTNQRKIKNLAEAIADTMDVRMTIKK